MSRDVITVGSTMRIPLLYRVEYSQWRERFLNYLEEQTDGLPNDIYSLIDSNDTVKELWDALERQMRGSEYGEQDRKAAILYEYETFKAAEGEQLLDTYLRYLQVINDLKKCGYKNDNCELNYKFLNNQQPEWKQYGTLIRQTKNLMDINIDALYNILKQNQGDVNDAMGYKKKAVVATSDPLALVAEKTKITALLAKAFNRKKYYAKPTNNNLRTSSASSSAKKKPEYVTPEKKKENKKVNEKNRDMSKVKCYNCKKEGHFSKDCKKAKVKDYNYYKTKMLLAKKDGDEQVFLTEDQAWMESNSDSNQEINANMVFMAKMEKVLLDLEESSSSAEETIAEVSYYTSDSESESEYETSEYYNNSTNYDHDESEVDHNDSEEKDHLVDKLIKKFNQKIAKYQKRIEKVNQQSKDLENQNKDLQDKYDVLKNQVNTFEEKNNEFNEQIKELNKKNDDLLAQTEVLQEQLKVKHVVIDTHTECQAQYAKLEEEIYQYMIRYYALCDNDKKHRKKIDEQEILFDKMSRQLVEMNNNVLRLQEKILEKQTKISELKEYVRNKDLEIEKCLERLNDCENNLHKIGQTRQTIHMIMPSKDKMYNGRKGIGFENLSYLCKAKELRPSLYDERVIGLGYTLMFLIHSDEALEIEKFKRARENKIKFAYDYGNLNVSYVNEKIIFSDDYFQEIINPDFEKIDSPFQQTSSLKPYVPTVILEKIIIDLEDEVVGLLEKEKENLEITESLKSKGFESSENAISESENQSENDCQVVEKSCDNLENSKVIAPGMFKINVSQSVSPISVSKTSFDSNNVENKPKRKRRKRTSSKQNDKQVNNDVLRANIDFVHFLDLDTISSVRRPKHKGVIWKKKGSSNTSSVDLSSVSNSKLNKDVKRYSRKDLLSCNNSHHVDTRSAYACNDAMNVSLITELGEDLQPKAHIPRLKQIHLKITVLHQYAVSTRRYGDIWPALHKKHKKTISYAVSMKDPICLQLTGPKLVQETTERIIQIKQRIRTARDRQESYADLKCKPMEFQVGDKVMLKVSPWKGVVRFGKRGKLNPRYVGPFKVLKKKCYSDDPLVVPLEGLQLDDKLHFVEEPVEIMDREVKQLRRSCVPIFKVRWNSRRGPEFTWEREDQFRKKYLHIFTKTAPSLTKGPSLNYNQSYLETGGSNKNKRKGSALGEKLAIFHELKGEFWLMNEYGVHKSWTKIVVHGFNEIPLVRPEFFYDNGKILFLTRYSLWIYDVEERGRRLQRYDLQLILCGDISSLQRKSKLRGSFVSFREMITSQLQGKLWLYDEVRTRLCLFCHHQIGEDCWDSRFDETK
ncbi:integrase, catalytic region, zinc finger, CCHC-type containing protein [Tanacetum coccineum]